MEKRGGKEYSVTTWLEIFVDMLFFAKNPRTSSKHLHGEYRSFMLLQCENLLFKGGGKRR